MKTIQTINEKIAMRSKLFIADPGHGWLRVTLEELMYLGIANKISEYSYQNGKYVYLEEDIDFSTWMNTLFPDENIIQEKREHYLKNVLKYSVCKKEPSSIRKYKNYKPYTRSNDC